MFRTSFLLPKWKFWKIKSKMHATATETFQYPLKVRIVLQLMQQRFGYPCSKYSLFAPLLWHTIYLIPPKVPVIQTFRGFTRLRLSEFVQIAEFLDALASLDFTLVSKSVSRQSFGFEAFKPVYMRQKTLDHDQWSRMKDHVIMTSWHHAIMSSFHHVILSSCHLVILSSCQSGSL